MPIKFEVNGKPVEVEVEPRLTLADCLRHHLRLTGTHVGCEHGVCGACTVLVNGAAVRSCLMLAVQADGAKVVTDNSAAHRRNRKSCLLPPACRNWEWAFLFLLRRSRVLCLPIQCRQ